MQITFPISEAQEMEMWFGTADDNLTRDVIFKGRPGRFCSIPFFCGGAYPYRKKGQLTCYQVSLLHSETFWQRLVSFKQILGMQVNLEDL